MGERSAAEAALVKAKPYTGEVVEVESSGPNTEDASYSFAYKGSDKAQQEESSAGDVKGSYSFKTEDGQEFTVKYTSGVGGFVVENIEDLLAQTNPQSAEYQAVLAEHAAIAAERESLASEAKRKSTGNTHSPAAETYVHNEIEAEPYIHEEIAAEPYIDEQVPYVHNEIVA